MEFISVLVTDFDVVGVIFFPVALIPVQPVCHIRVFLYRSAVAVQRVPHHLRSQLHLRAGRQLLVPVELFSLLIKKPHFVDHSVDEDLPGRARAFFAALRVDQHRPHFQFYLIRLFIERLHDDRSVSVKHIVPQLAAGRCLLKVPVIPLFDDPVSHMPAVHFIVHPEA